MANTVGQPWYDFPITQSHGANGELGVDLGTPFGTAITDVFGGKVVDASYGPWGGDVHVLTTAPSGQPIWQEFLHLDQIRVSPGQMVNPGDLIGYSGGQLSGGTHPAPAPYSTGPHTEFGLYTSRTANASTALDPTGVISALTTQGTGGLGDVWSQVWQDVTGFVAGPGGTGPAAAGTAALASDATQGAGNLGGSIVKWLENLAVFQIGIVILFVGLLAFFFAGRIGNDSPAVHAARGVAFAAKVAK